MVKMVIDVIWLGDGFGGCTGPKWTSPVAKINGREMPLLALPTVDIYI